MLTSLLSTSQLFTAATVAGAVGTGVSALAGYQASRMQQATANYNAQVAQQTAAAEEKRQARNDVRALASARASQAASGVLVDSGSSLSVLTDMASQMAENRLQIRYGGQVQAANARNRASAYGQQATGALIGGAAGIGTGLLSANYTYSRHLDSQKKP